MSEDCWIGVNHTSLDMRSCIWTCLDLLLELGSFLLGTRRDVVLQIVSSVSARLCSAAGGGGFVRTRQRRRTTIVL
jgi:hypothetical protein